MPQIVRRDFIKMWMIAGFNLIIPGILSCKAKEAPGPGEACSRVELRDIEGNRITIPADSAGKIAVLHFWASRCSACRDEMTTLETLCNKYRSEGVAAYSIGIGENRKTAMSYIKNLQITYPILPDPGAVTQNLFGISGIPTYYILDRKGLILYKIVGEADKDKMEKIIKSAL